MGDPPGVAVKDAETDDSGGGGCGGGASAAAKTMQLG